MKRRLGGGKLKLRLHFLITKVQQRGVEKKNEVKSVERGRRRLRDCGVKTADHQSRPDEIVRRGRLRRKKKF